MKKRHLACKYSHYEYSIVDRTPRVIRNYARRFLLSDGSGSPTKTTVEEGKKSQLMTLLLFVGAILDNFIERIREIEPFRKDVIIYDRYFYDHLVRSGFSWPPWMTRTYLNTVPKPDLTILLDVSASIAYQRKPEVPVALLSQQRLLYVKLGQTLGTASFLLINAELPFQQVSSLIEKHVSALLKGLFLT